MARELTHRLTALGRARPPGPGGNAALLGDLISVLLKKCCGERWVHEIKFDGYRVQVHVAHEAVRSSPSATTGPIVSARLLTTPGTSLPVRRSVVVPAESGTTAWVARFWKSLQIV